MSALTTRLGLYKPGGGLSGTNLPDEVVDIDKINGNMDVIDTVIGAPRVTSTTRPSSPFNGQLIIETDTGNVMSYSSTVSRWIPVGTPSAASLAARDALYPTPAVGDAVYRTDLKYEQVYSGTQWRGTVGVLTPIIPTGSAGSTGTSITIGPNGKVAFTGASLVKLQGVFSTEFDTYLMMLDVDSQSVDANVLVQLVAGVTSANGNNYSSMTISGGGGVLTQTSASLVANAQIGRTAAGGGSLRAEFFNPSLPKITRIVSESFDSQLYRQTVGSIHNLSVAYDGLMFVTAANVTGTLRFYGYNNN